MLVCFLRVLTDDSNKKLPLKAVSAIEKWEATQFCCDPSADLCPACGWVGSSHSLSFQGLLSSGLNSVANRSKSGSLASETFRSVCICVGETSSAMCSGSSSLKQLNVRRVVVRSRQSAQWRCFYKSKAEDECEQEKNRC